MAPSRSKAPEKDAKKLGAKLGRAGPTASGYEAVVDAGALLAMGGAVPEALECLKRVWACPESVHRLLVQGRDPKEHSYATWMFKKLGACVAPVDTARALSLTRRALLAEVDAEEGRCRVGLDDYLHSPKDHESDRRKATKQAVELLGSMSRAVKGKRFDTALVAGRELVELEASHPHYGCLRKRIVADIAFEAGEREAAYAMVVSAANAARGRFGFVRDALDLLLDYEWSRTALVQGKLDLPPLDAIHVELLMESVSAFFLRVAEPAEKKVAWRPLLRKLAGSDGLRKGAASRTIAALEKRLGVTLPPSYKAFLATSNGLAESETRLAFHPAAEVAWFRDVNKDWIDAYATEGAVIPHMADTLRLAEPRDGEVYLLNPSVKTSDGEWEAWHFANYYPGEVRYTSFLELVEDLAECD